MGPCIWGFPMETKGLLPALRCDAVAAATRLPAWLTCSQLLTTSANDDEPVHLCMLGNAIDGGGWTGGKVCISSSPRLQVHWLNASHAAM